MLMKYVINVGYSNKLDALQLESARIITSLPIFARSISIYKDKGNNKITELRTILQRESPNS